jgi:hypothetical protein
MKRKCCRSTPRCARCPVLAVAAVRRERHSRERAALVTEIFAGRSARRLPQAVVDALERLDAARTADADAMPDGLSR